MEIKESLGYLYNGYLLHAYYWESIILYRKVVMVMVSSLLSSFGKKIQAGIVFGFLGISLAHHNVVKPYMFVRLNWLETISI